MCKKLTSLLLTFVFLLSMVSISVQAEEAATADFVIAASEVEVHLGSTEVIVPLKITKMYEDKLIGSLTVEVNYDAEKLTFNEADWVNGSMIKVPSDVSLDVMTPGLIRIMFSSATDPISPDMVDVSSMFGAVRFGIKDPTAPFVSAINLTTNDGLYDDMADTLIAMDDMGASLKAGKVTVRSDSTVDAKQIYVKEKKTYYTVGDEFVKPVIEAVTTNSTICDISSEVTFTGYDMSKVGTQTVTATYRDKTTFFTIVVREPVYPYIESIEITDAKTEYLVGENFVMPTVIGVYCDGSTKVIRNAVSFTGFYMDRPGTQTIIAKFEDITTTYTITVKEVTDVTLVSLELSNVKTEYIVGDKFVLPTVTGVYSDGSRRVLTGGVYYDNSNSREVGTRTVTVRFQDKSVAYTINVRENAASDTDFAVEIGDITAEKGATTIDVPVKITKMYEDENIACLELRVIYDTDKFTWTDTDFTPGAMISNPDADLIMALVQEGEIKISFTTEYEERALTKAMVNADNTLMTLKLTVKDTTAPFTSEVSMNPGSKVLNSDMETLISKTDLAKSLKAGTVTYAQAAEAELESIAVSGAKTTYNVGDAFVAPTVTATYSDGTTAVVEATFTGYNMATAGTQTVTVMYGGKTATYNITVKGDGSTPSYNEKNYRIVESQFPWSKWNSFTGGGTTNVPVSMNFVEGEAENGAGKALVITGGNTGTGAYAGGQFMIPPTFDLTDVIILRLRYNSTAPITIKFERLYDVKVGTALPPLEVDNVKEMLGDNYSSYFDSNNVCIKSYVRAVTSSGVKLPSTNGVWQTIDVPIADFGDNEFLKAINTNIGINLSNGLNNISTSFMPAYLLRIEGNTYGEDTSVYFKLDSITGICTKLNLASVPDAMHGDTSDDGVVNTTDVMCYKNYIEYNSSIKNPGAADVNLDGSVNTTDLIILKNYLDQGVPIIK